MLFFMEVQWDRDLGGVCLNLNVNVFSVASNNTRDKALEIRREQASGNVVAIVLDQKSSDVRRWRGRRERRGLQLSLLYMKVGLWHSQKCI